MGKVGVPALQAGAGDGRGKTPTDHLQLLKTQVRPPPLQVVVAHAHATRQHQEAIEVEVGEELGGEVADGQAAGTLQGREQSVPGEPVDGGSGFRAVGEDPIQQPEGAGAGDALFQLMAQNGEIDAGKTPRNAARGRGSSWNPSVGNTSGSRNRTLS
jgi:hypothetical protein